METNPWLAVRWLFGPGPSDGPGHLWPRWLFLRCLGLIFFSAFYSLLFQIHGLIGPDGILPAGQFLRALAERFGALSLWYAPTLLWLRSGSLALALICWTGLVASALLVLNVWPRAAMAVCLVDFLSFVSAAQDFSSYQSDGMLLAAGFLCLFFAPVGLRPGLGERHPPSRASRFLLQWLWFRIYFESGCVKLLSGETQWRDMTAMDHYYENGPLPDWIGWYAQQLPHGFHATVALATLIVELGLVWVMFLPRRFRILCFFIVTPFQIGIILTANLGFLNYLVLVLGVLLLDDRFLRGLFKRLAGRFENRNSKFEIGKSKLEIRNARLEERRSEIENQKSKIENVPSTSDSGLFQSLLPSGSGPQTPDSGLHYRLSLVTHHWSLLLSALFLSWIFYVTTALLLLMLFPRLPLPVAPIVALEPLRIANQYGLFAVMTRARYEVEFQGTRDGKTWIAYPFRYKPQDPMQPPKIHAPYQPRFDWNLWFASLGHWRAYSWVALTEMRLLQNSPSVLSLFAGNPFPGDPPRQVRAVIWQYWFTDLATKRAQGLWWRREMRGLYAPTLEREPDGRIVVVEWPEPGALPQTTEP